MASYFTSSVSIFMSRRRVQLQFVSEITYEPNTIVANLVPYKKRTAEK